MLFFKRILDGRKDPGAPVANRRVAARFVVHRQFPVKAVLMIAGRDEAGALLKPDDREGWDWPGRLVNLSTTGARMQVPRSVIVHRDDLGRLKLDVQGYQLEIPCRIAHVVEQRDSYIFGLALDLGDADVKAAYHQLIDLVAMGSSLKLVKKPKPDESGYLLEQYAGEPATCLSVWRQPAGRVVTAFEFLLKDCFVRGLAADDRLECFTGTEKATARTVTAAQAEEIKRLYQWVVLNLAPAVPAEVRAFLLKHAM